MQRLFALLILVAMTFGGVAFSQATSTPVQDGTGWNNARLTLAVQGQTPDQVEFTVPAWTLVLDSGALAPGQQFDVVVPITNTSDRPILVSDVLNENSAISYNEHPAYGSYFVVANPGSQQIPANTMQNRSYTVTIVANNGLVPGDTNDQVTIYFTLHATGVNSGVGTQTFGQ
ncbi:MAG: hypothetical protein U5L75_00895 [Candidatus Campbellbacteria bacterium]|nr:hypothetical protein [Candidatus Campbellbacteria bacterium]